MDIPGDTHDVGPFDEVDGENEKLQPLSLSTLSLGESEKRSQGEILESVEQVDELAVTIDPDGGQPDSNTDVKTVDVNDATVLTPSRLTLYYPNATPESITHFLSVSSLLTLSVDKHVPIGRNKPDQPHIFLNSDTMSRFYGQIRMDRNQCFWVKNVSKTKMIEVQFSKGKKRQSQLLKCDHESEIKTNYIVKFHTLEFKAVITLGDLENMNYEVVLEKEPEKPARNNSPTHQVIYNQGQINRLYMSGESQENNTGHVVNRTRVNSGGSAMDSGIAGYIGPPLHPSPTPGYGPPPISAGNGYPQIGPYSPVPGLPWSGSANGYPQYQPHMYHESGPAFGAPTMHGHGPHMFNLPTQSSQYPPVYIGPQYGHPRSLVPGQHIIRSPGGYGLQPPPYYPPTSGGGLNPAMPTDTSNPVLVPSSEKRTEYFHFPTQPQSPIGNMHGHYDREDQRRPVENSEAPDPVARLMQKAEYRNTEPHNSS